MLHRYRLKELWIAYASEKQSYVPYRINVKCNVRIDQFYKIRDDDISICFQSMKVRKGLSNEEILRKKSILITYL